MSTRNPQTTHRTTGGTIRAETTNPALLSLLRDNSQVGANTTATRKPPASSPRAPILDSPAPISSARAPVSVSRAPKAPAVSSSQSHVDVVDSLEVDAAARAPVSPARSHVSPSVNPGLGAAGTYRKEQAHIPVSPDKPPILPSAQSSGAVASKALVGQGDFSEDSLEPSSEPESPVPAENHQSDNPPKHSQGVRGHAVVPPPRSVSQYAEREGNPVTFQGERSGKQNLAVTPVSRDLSSDTDSASSELAFLVGTPSRKSLAFSATVTDTDSPQDQGDTDDEEEELTPTAGEQGKESPTEEEEKVTPTEGTYRKVGKPDSAEQVEDSEEENDDVDEHETHVNPPRSIQGGSTSQTLPGQSPLPAGGRSSVTSVANPLVVRRAVPPSPDLQHPDHARFVTPYASRRLKDRHLDRNSAVGGVQGATRSGDRVQLTEKIPKDHSWSANQAAKLRAQETTVQRTQQSETDEAQETDANNNGGSFSFLDSESPPRHSHHLHRRRSSASRGGHSAEGSPVDQQKTVDSLKVPHHHKPPSHPQSRPASDSSRKDRRLEKSVTPGELVSPSPAVDKEVVAITAQTYSVGGGTVSRASSSHSVRQRESTSPPTKPRSALKSTASAIPTPTRPQSREKNSASLHPRTSSTSSPLLVVEAAHRVYVESPSFTQAEEEQYRFVSSRVEHYDEHETYRALDESAVRIMEGNTVGMRPARKPFKQVRYQDDEDRFEDREDILRYKAGEPRGRAEREEEPTPTIPSKQYVLKPKNGSADNNRQLTKPQAVRGLVLPSGPSWDPGDEEDLKRESNYQEELKHRISDAQRHVEETTIPRLPLWAGESEDFMRDSLDIPEDIELDSERHNIHRDSLDVYEQQRLQHAMRNTQWEDPPAPPPRAQFVQPQMGRGGPNAGRGGPVGYMNNYQQQQMMDADFTPRNGGQYAVGAEYEEQYAYGANPQQMRPDQLGYAQNPPPQMRPDPSGQRPNPAQQQMRPDMQQGQFSQQPRGYYAQQQPALGYYGQQQQQQQQPQMPYNQQQYMSEVDPILQSDRRPVQAARPGHYMERGAPQNIQAGASAELKEGFYLTEPRGYAPGQGAGAMAPHRPDFDSNVDDGTVGFYQNRQMLDSDRYEAADDSAQSTERKGSAPYELGKPEKPAYDYVSHNKFDYGRAPKRTYKKIHEVQKEEKEKLTGFFIQPKVKGKGETSQRTSRDNSPSRYPAIAENPGDDMVDPSEQYDTGAEQLWAQRSATLARAKKPQARKKQNSNSSLLSNSNRRQYHSDSSLSSAVPPSINQQLVPAPQYSSQQVTPMQSPPMRRLLDLKPITQELVTEDGQRISVDVNLRLISPPIAHQLEGSPRVEGHAPQWQGQGQRKPGYQYPVEDVTTSNGQHPYQDENDYPQGRYSADDVLSSKNYGGYTSDGNHDYSPTAFTTNPYKKIPPITSKNDSGAPRSAPVQSEGSYMLSYLREKEKNLKGDKPWYRVYGMKDYKRMQKEVRLGTLGPDLTNDDYKEKREKALRQMEYAKSVKAKNTQELLTKKPPAFPRPKEQDDIMDKRKVAKEYSKNVPKPTVKPKPSPYNSYELASQLSPIAKSHTKGHHSSSPSLESSVEVLDLQKLHDRHEQDKRSAALIRQKATGVIT